MGMMIVEDDDFDKELLRNKGVTPKVKPIEVEIKKDEKGRGIGNVEVPNTLRNVIADTAISHGRSEAIALAKSFGISESSVSAYTNGSTSTTTYDKKVNGEFINNAKLRVSNKARKKLLLALHHMTEEKISGANVQTLAGVAKDMSVIIKNMEPSDKDNGKNVNNGPNFIFYSPNKKDEDVYDAIYVKE
jgi:hypothetical protein